ncbi:MAG: hypothetical protein LLG13_12870 [Bacteroidales bacterium]|nr:hypothetical protein [Bacteroidales bacterium]
MKTTNETKGTESKNSTEIKQFATVQEWLKSSPKEDEIKKVLELINRGAKRELRVELYHKQNELRKTLRFATQMNESGFKVPADVEAKAKELENEVKEIQSILPPPVKKVKKVETPEVKEEPKVE